MRLPDIVNPALYWQDDTTVPTGPMRVNLPLDRASGKFVMSPKRKWYLLKPSGYYITPHAAHALASQLFGQIKRSQDCTASVLRQALVYAGNRPPARIVERQLFVPTHGQRPVIGMTLSATAAGSSCCSSAARA
jgi:hypothetical protein